MLNRTAAWLAALGIVLATLVWAVLSGLNHEADSAPGFADLRSDDLELIHAATHALRKERTRTALPDLRAARSGLHGRLVKASKFDLSPIAASRPGNELFRVTDLRSGPGRQRMQVVLNELNRAIWEIDHGAEREAAEREELGWELERDDRQRRAAVETESTDSIPSPESETVEPEPGPTSTELTR